MLLKKLWLAATPFLFTPIILSTAGCSDTGRSDLELGDCIDANLDSGKVENIKPADCEDPHFGQVVGILDVTGGPYPGSDRLTEETASQCKEAAEEFAQIELLASAYDLATLVPSESSWESGDHDVLCVLHHSLGNELEGSLHRPSSPQSQDADGP